MLSGSEALALFNFLFSCLISFFDDGLAFAFSSSSTLLIAGVIPGDGLFTNSLRCFVHLAK